MLLRIFSAFGGIGLLLAASILPSDIWQNANPDIKTQGLAITLTVFCAVLIGSGGVLLGIAFGRK